MVFVEAPHLKVPMKERIPQGWIRLKG